MGFVFNFLENYLMGPLNKIASTKFIRALMNAGFVTIPFTIVGSIFLILNNLPQIFPFLTEFFQNSVLKYSSLYMIGNTMAIGSIALFYVLATGYYLTDIYKKEEGIKVDSFSGAVLALYAFLMTIIQVGFVDGTAKPLSKTSETSIIFNGVEVGGWIARFSGQGIFIGIITAVLAVHIYLFCVKKNITIKMPKGVPDGVSRSFAALIPTIFISFVMIFINTTLALLGTDLFKILSTPFGFVQYIAGSWIGVVVIMLLVHMLWAVGVHGTAIVKNAFVNPILLVALTENINGANNIFAGDFTNMYVFLGGAGSTLGLVLLMLFRSKSKQLKVLGKTAFIPGLFNINEPIIFGAPIVYNPYLVIPFIIAPIVTASLTYFSISVGFISKVIAGIPWVSPVGLGAFLGTAGDFKAVILAFINLFISVVIYYPFFKMYDTKLYKEQITTEG